VIDKTNIAPRLSFAYRLGTYDQLILHMEDFIKLLIQVFYCTQKIMILKIQIITFLIINTLEVNEHLE
jgi:hypothetical protein